VALLRVFHVSAHYGSHQVLHDVSFELPMGEALCVLGPNGCGKTTLLRAIAALIPFQGEITLNGVPIRSMTRLRIASHIAMMCQAPKVYFAYSVYDTVMLGRYRHLRQSLLGRPSAKDRECVERCLEATGISALRNKRIDQLSGGQLQRVFLAQTLAQDPDVILLDEPMNHLDMKHQVELVDYLKAWAKSQGRAIIGVFHDINLALRLSDSVLFLKDGRVAARGRFHAIATPAFLKEIYGLDVVAYMLESFGKWAAFRKTNPLEGGTTRGASIPEPVPSLSLSD